MPNPPIPIWDTQDAPGNVMMVAQLRGGCHRWPPGWHGRKHSHDGAVEVFFAVEGACDFDVDGQQFTLHAGQFVVIPPEVPHELWNRTNEDLLMFLVVAPHRQPTHTFYDEAGQPIGGQKGTGAGSTPGIRASVRRGVQEKTPGEQQGT